MKHQKVGGLLVAAGFALLALAATASAEVTSPTGSGYTQKVHIKSIGYVTIDNPVTPIACEHTKIVDIHKFRFIIPFVYKKKTTHKTTLSNCTYGWHVTIVAEGEESIEHTSGYNGDIFSTGETIEATNPGLGNITCRYATNNTTMGTFTGGSPATIDISASIPFHSGSVFCGAGATAMTGTLEVTSPSSLYID